MSKEKAEGDAARRGLLAERELRIIELSTGKVVKSFDVSKRSEREIEKIEMGMLRNMDLERFSVEDTGVRTAGAPSKDPSHD